MASRDTAGTSVLCSPARGSPRRRSRIARERTGRSRAQTSLLPAFKGRRWVMTSSRPPMPGQSIQRILTINTGSSSLKVAIYEAGAQERRILSGIVERIGVGQSLLRLTDDSGATLVQRESALADHGAALEAVLDWLKQNRPELSIDAL